VKAALEEEREIILAALQENMDNKISRKQKIVVLQQEQKKKNWLQKCFSFL